MKFNRCLQLLTRIIFFFYLYEFYFLLGPCACGWVSNEGGFAPSENTYFTSYLAPTHPARTAADGACENTWGGGNLSVGGLGSSDDPRDEPRKLIENKTTDVAVHTHTGRPGFSVLL